LTWRRSIGGFRAGKLGSKHSVSRKHSNRGGLRARR
jgi:hypothetical protein